jgi:hypothetical protein
MLAKAALPMSFIRPEAAQELRRWREALVGAGLCLGGFWVALNTHGLTSTAGASVLVVGTIMLFLGVQRARFRVGAGGAGLVQVDEGQVTYFGPRDGGTIALELLERVDLEPAGEDGARWLLTQAGQPPLAVPTDAAGGEALFDVFASLPGLHTERMLTELKRRPGGRVTIWKSAQRVLR